MEAKKHLELPALPGVYLFKTGDEIIYVGKAKILKKRVSSYFQKQHDDWKVKALIDEHTHIEHIVTHSEPEALLLEAQLIRDHQPKYNVLLKNGQPFLYILFTKEPLPKLELVRNKEDKGTFFGPFLHKRQARSAYEYLLKTFKLSWCSKKIPNGCLNYHLGMCAGNCKENFEAQDYLFRIQLTKDVLRGRYQQSLKNLMRQIRAYSDQLEFEKAKNLTHYLKNLDVIFQTLKARFSEDKYEKEIVFATSPLHRRTIQNQSLGKHIKELLGLEKEPATIDCFDISHFQSSYIVGSCIRFKYGIPDKDNFRRFKIRTLVEQNDYAALQEIVSRRYKNPTDLPDLIVIDGGKGQLSAVKQLFLQAEIVSLAKREERLFSARFPQGIVLDGKTEAGLLFIGLRDYAHHFAVSYHKLLRSKEYKKR